MAFTNEQLEALEAAYAAGVTTVKHGDKIIEYDSLEALWAAIQRIRRALRTETSRYKFGIVGFRKA